MIIHFISTIETAPAKLRYGPSMLEVIGFETIVPA